MGDKSRLCSVRQRFLYWACTIRNCISMSSKGVTDDSDRVAANPFILSIALTGSVSIKASTARNSLKWRGAFFTVNADFFEQAQNSATQSKNRTGEMRKALIKTRSFQFCKDRGFRRKKVFFREKSQPIEKCCTFAAEIWLSGR